MVAEIVNPRILVLNSTTPYNLNVLDTYFPLLFFNSQQMKPFWRGKPRIHRNYKSAFHPSRKCDFV